MIACQLVLFLLKLGTNWSYCLIYKGVRRFDYLDQRKAHIDLIKREDFLVTLHPKSLNNPISPYPQQSDSPDETKNRFSWTYSEDFTVKTQLQNYPQGNLSLQYLSTFPPINLESSYFGTVDCLRNASFFINDILITENRITVNWNLTFFPSTIQSVLVIINLLRPHCHREFFDLLPYERIISEFSWQRLFQFFKDLLIFNKAKIPIAKILGKTEMMYVEKEILPDKNNLTNSIKKIYTFNSMTETVQLIENINNQITQNRRIVLDLLEYLNARRIANLEDLNEYNSLILQRVRFFYISNMNMMSVDGLNRPNQLQTNQIINASNIVLALFTSIILLVGAAFALTLLSNMFAPDSNYYIENRDYLG